jgi:hypothetical protein
VNNRKSLGEIYFVLALIDAAVGTWGCAVWIPGEPIAPSDGAIADNDYYDRGRAGTTTKTTTVKTSNY